MRTRTIFRDGAAVRTINSEHELQNYRTKKTETKRKEKVFTLHNDASELKIVMLANEHGYKISKAEIEEFKAAVIEHKPFIVCISREHMHIRTFVEKTVYLRRMLEQDRYEGTLYEYSHKKFTEINPCKYGHFPQPKQPKKAEVCGKKVFECNSGTSKLFKSCQTSKTKKRAHINNFGRNVDSYIQLTNIGQMVR